MSRTLIDVFKNDENFCIRCKVKRRAYPARYCHDCLKLLEVFDQLVDVKTSLGRAVELTKDISDFEAPMAELQYALKCLDMVRRKLGDQSCG